MYDSEPMAKRGRPPKDPADVKSEWVMIRVSENEKAALLVGSELDEAKDLSDWLRTLGLKRAARLVARIER